MGSTITIFILWLLYFGNYLPLRKNLLLSDALRTTEISQALQAGNKVMNYYSPVGQQEAYESIGRNFVIYFEQLGQKGLKADSNNKTFKDIMAFNDTWFEKIKSKFQGIKDFYLAGIWNLAAFKLSHDPVYLEKANIILEEAAVMAPNRLEIIITRLDLARLTSNEERQIEMLNKIKALRPDLLEKFLIQSQTRSM